MSLDVSNSQDMQDTNAEIDFDNLFEGLGEAEDMQDTNADSTVKVQDQKQQSEDDVKTNTEKTTENETKKADVPDDVTIEVDFLGEKKAYKVDEAKPILQKGLNYDHIKTKAEAAESKVKEIEPIYEELLNVAAQNGMNVNDMLTAIKDSQRKAAIKNLTDNGTPEPVAIQMVDMVMADNIAKAQAAKLQAAAETEKLNKQKADAELERFIKTYPDVKELPAEVINLVQSGLTPCEAYAKYDADTKAAELKRQIDDLQLKLAGQTQNIKNAQTAPGSASGEATGEEKDAFLSGFMSAF